MSKQKAARRPKSSRQTRFPGESAKYRTARNDLLKAEKSLRRQLEMVAAKRRKLPLGGALPEDYLFEELTSSGAVRQVRFSELFAGGKGTLIIYNYMFGPQAAAPCPLCTSILDSLDGAAPHVSQRASLAVVAKAPIQTVMEFARSRGWQHLRLLSSAHNTYNRDYHGETPEGDQLPSLNVFVRRGARISHFYHTELLFGPERGQDARHVDLIWPLWHLLDVTPEGRGTTWYPQLRYE
jgi:predicted dithiol-disulfide oxidoreductase (DUF899 family)